MFGCELVFGNLECDVRHDLKPSDIGIRNAALNGLKIDGENTWSFAGHTDEHKENQFQVFQCHCGSESVRICIFRPPGVTNKSFQLAKSIFTFHVEMFFFLGEPKASLVIIKRSKHEN